MFLRNQMIATISCNSLDIEDISNFQLWFFTLRLMLSIENESYKFVQKIIFPFWDHIVVFPCASEHWFWLPSIDYFMLRTDSERTIFNEWSEQWFSLVRYCSIACPYWCKQKSQIRVSSPSKFCFFQFPFLNQVPLSPRWIPLLELLLWQRWWVQQRLLGRGTR